MRPLRFIRARSDLDDRKESVAWGVVASLIETCKLNGVEPHGYLTDVLTKLAQGWPASRLDDLLPWAYVA